MPKTAQQRAQARIAIVRKKALKIEEISPQLEHAESLAGMLALSHLAGYEEAGASIGGTYVGADLNDAHELWNGAPSPEETKTALVKIAGRAIALLMLHRELHP